MGLPSKMKKKYILIFGIFIIIIFGNVLVSAVCCEKLKNSNVWCQSALNVNECNVNYFIWRNIQTCDSVPECSGTCVNANSGECSENTAKTQCEESGGVWNEESSGEISECQEVCCLLGQDAYFINPTECRAMFTQNNIQGIIREDITSRERCEEMRSNLKVGACVISTLTEKSCRIKTSLECTSDKINELSEYLQNPSSRNEIDIKFYDGLLCTASVDVNGVKISISDCAKSTNTECKDNKVYYKDLCGNFANIYDSNKYDKADYWTYIKNPYTSNDVCPVTSSGSNICGNCDPTENTVCRDYKETGLSKPSNNLGGLVCGDLSCKYKGKTYEHGESWCEGTAGTFEIKRNLTTSKISKSNITALKNENKYNLPGSRYYKLICSFGEVLIEECGDYRNSVCIQGEKENGKSDASCVFNNWRTCFQIETKTECENPASLCKWIPGYRWDFEIVPENQRKERQGSCVPLVAPGFDFWKETSQGNGICGMGYVQEYAMFESSIWSNRDNIAEWKDKRIANNCLNGCYALPGYAQEFNQKTGEEKSYPEDVKCNSGQGTGAGCSTMYSVLTEFYDESGFKLTFDVNDYLLSDRRGQYCNKDGKPDYWLTGQVRGPNYDCTALFGGASKDEEKERDYPIYLTNQEWLNGITERARSLGDCGYKVSINGKYSAPETEIITAIFQKMSQKGKVKENLTVEQIIYKGGKAVPGELYEKILPYTATSYSCAPNYKGICTSTVNNPALCEGGEQNEEATCPEKSVCCVYPELS